MNNKYIVIIAGGKGERFWPMSRLKYPKHVQAIVGNQPIIVQTLERLIGLVKKENILIITNKSQKDAIYNICKDYLTLKQIIIEPEGRDTAAAIGLASIIIKNINPNAILAVLPADHIIKEKENFQKTLNAAFEIALNNQTLITIGITPREASTSYGYIKKGEKNGKICGLNMFLIDQFIEKPDQALANEYFKSGNYYWNAGMFIWSVQSILQSIEQHYPKLFNILQEATNKINNNQQVEEYLKISFSQLEKISIDYAIMEKASNIMVIEAKFDWDDVGEWEAIARHFISDNLGNTINGIAITEDSNNNIIVNEEDHLTALIGVNNSIIIQTKNATLICPRKRSKEIKALVQKLSKNPKLTKYT